MITRSELEARRAEYERQEQQALADANAAHGAIVAIESLLSLFDEQEAVKDDGASSNPN